MPESRQLLHGQITYSAAKERETNVLHALGYWDQRLKFFSHLYRNRKLIEAVALQHLGLGRRATCRIAEPDDWLHGSFNLCIPITVDHGKESGRRVMVRFPLPYRVGEDFRPGNVDEKLRCEAGTYAWLQGNCPSVPIPRLYGFGLTSGERFTVLENLPLIPRCLQYLRRRLLNWLGYPVPSLYVRHQDRGHAFDKLGTGYLVIEYIESSQGRMLSETWNEKRNDKKLRTNLLRGLSRILLALAGVPLPRIGSFVIDDDGFLSLNNRPLTLEIQDLENQRIPVDMARDCMYSTVDSYVHDILAFHDSRLRHQPNAVNDVEDCLFQMAALTVMKTVSSHFFRPELRRGPFFLSLTDLHQSNIFVDDDWNIKCLVDMEWGCSRPVEMVHPPYWLTNQPVDGIDVAEYEKAHNEFMATLAEEEADTCRGRRLLSPVLQCGWEMGTFWYTLALDSPTGLFRLFYDHIQPRFAKEHIDNAAFFQIMMAYWTVNATEFIHAKVKDKEDYDRRLHEAFQD